ncbi:MAG: dihydropteroate synthase, partial [Anaerolineales bacterium]|nr:dihydropteroate synthase [Anaerolineales bacterium]
MGILNVTPDSFSGDGLLSPSPDFGRGARGEGNATLQSKWMLDSGADILDIGGESTRPGSQPVTVSEELERVIPVIHSIHKNFPDALISSDTYKA